ncbi:hypothetical protein AA0120_g5584 [Alternaria tenuissima]|nr:hypothetical protein AA0120_g5584 [Alternaria tenuissima]
MDGNNTFLGAAAVPAGEPSDIASHDALDGADGAECATTGIRESTPVPITPTDETSAGYKCVTQSGDDVEAINVGLPDQVPRFKPGSVIKYISYYSGWPGGQGQLVSDTMWAAATDWNSRNPGVKFQWTLVRAEAAFEVVYGGAHATAVASAFFPNKPRGAQPRQLLVYDGTFTPSGLARMRNSFQHELGHVSQNWKARSDVLLQSVCERGLGGIA